MATAATSATTGTNFDVASIVGQLMTVEQRPLTALATKEASYQAKLSAYGTIKSAVSTFQGALTGLSSVSQFQALNATSSDSTVVTTSASSTAATGAYTLDVTNLAQAQKLVAVGRASQTAAIGAGASTTLTFDFGTIAGNTFSAATGKYGTALSATTTNGSATVTAPTANLAVGAAISGAGIPAGATIASITDANNFVISALATANGVGVALQANATFTSSGSGTKTVTINATNNSLQGIRDAINSANIGVTATIVNDGSATPYRLALSSNSTGLANSIKISTNVATGGDATVDGLLANDPANNLGQNLSETATALNANIKVNGIAVSKASNTITDAIQGVTLNLLKTTTTSVNVTVAQNTSAASSSISNFVKAYNALSSTLQSSSAYNPATKKGAILQGDSTVRSLQTQMHAVLNNSVTGSSGSLTTLSQIGITFQKDGTLGLDTAKLNTAISSNFSDIASLFAAVGKSTDSLVTYNAATSSTQPGSYAVNVTTLAAQGSSTGSINLNTVNDGINGVGITAIANGTTINASLNGTSASVALTAGTYTATQLATMIQSAINGTSAFAGSSVAATISGGGLLSLTSNIYGSPSNISLSNGAGTAVTAFMGAPTNTGGADVAGSIGGVATTGSGQYLTATAGNAVGLQIQVNGGATGARGTVNYSQGYAYTLNTLATSMLATGGLLDSVTTGINSSITNIGKQRDVLNTRLSALQTQYTQQFSALDVMLSNMNSTSTYLTQQLANLPKA